jgi:hypothetical protein
MQLISLYSVYMDVSVGSRHIPGLILIISDIDWLTKGASVQNLLESFDPFQRSRSLQMSMYRVDVYVMFRCCANGDNQVGGL